VPYRGPCTNLQSPRIMHEHASRYSTAPSTGTLMILTDISQPDLVVNGVKKTREGVIIFVRHKHKDPGSKTISRTTTPYYHSLCLVSTVLMWQLHLTVAMVFTCTSNFWSKSRRELPDRLGVLTNYRINLFLYFHCSLQKNTKQICRLLQRRTWGHC
jgi:hypothetical protein